MSKHIITQQRYGVYGRNSFKNQVQRNFKAIRESKGMTVAEAAEGMGVTVSSVYYILEAGETMSLEFLTRACEFYGCTPNDVLMQDCDDKKQGGL